MARFPSTASSSDHERGRWKYDKLDQQVDEYAEDNESTGSGHEGLNSAMDPATRGREDAIA